jgi:hypothetical protein
MCYEAFKSHVDSKWLWISLLSDPPKDLLAYGKKPKTKISTPIKPKQHAERKK